MDLLYADVIWKGSPELRKFTNQIDNYIIPFSLCLFVFISLATFFVAFGNELAGFGAGEKIFCLFILTFLNVSVLYVAFGRFFIKYRIKLNTEYYITQQKIIIKTGGNQTTKVIEYDICDVINTIYIHEIDKNGVGTIYLKKRGFRNIYDNTGLDIFGSLLCETIALYDIPHCNDVIRIISTCSAHNSLIDAGTLG